MATISLSALMDLSLDWTVPLPKRRGWRGRVVRFFSTTTPVNHIETSATSSDEQLVAAIVGGNPEPFEIIMDRYKSKILGTASRFARNQQELEDLGQEIFLKAWKGLPSFKATAPFEHWLMRLTVRVCYDFLRKNRRHRENEISKEVVDDLDQRLTENPAGDPEVEAREAREVLHLAMSKLRPKDQLILTLRELEGRSVKEIADLTGWSESNVKVRAMRARLRLKQILIDMGYAD